MYHKHCQMYKANKIILPFHFSCEEKNDFIYLFIYLLYVILFVHFVSLYSQRNRVRDVFVCFSYYYFLICLTLCEAVKGPRMHFGYLPNCNWFVLQNENSLNAMYFLTVVLLFSTSCALQMETENFGRLCSCLWCTSFYSIVTF